RHARFEVDLGWARFNTGHGPAAVSGLAEAADRAEAAGNRVAQLGLRLERLNLESAVAPMTDATARQLRELAEQGLPVFDAAGDEWGLTVACGSLLIAELLDGRSQADIAVAAEQVAVHGRRADDRVWIDWAESQLVIAQSMGATPVEECLGWLDEHPDVERRSVLPHRDRLLAMLGRFDEAERLLTEAAGRLAELGAVRFDIFLLWRRFEVAMLEGEADRAEAAAREMCDTAEASADLGNFMFFSCGLAQALLQLGRDDEAELSLERGREIAPSDERHPQILWPQVRGKLLARRGELEEGERLAREAVALAVETDMLNLHADALLDLAGGLTLAGRDARAGVGAGARALRAQGQSGHGRAHAIEAGRARSADRLRLRVRPLEPGTVRRTVPARRTTVLPRSGARR